MDRADWQRDRVDPPAPTRRWWPELRWPRARRARAGPPPEWLGPIGRVLLGSLAMTVGLTLTAALIGALVLMSLGPRQHEQTRSPDGHDQVAVREGSWPFRGEFVVEVLRTDDESLVLCEEHSEQPALLDWQADRALRYRTSQGDHDLRW